MFPRGALGHQTTIITLTGSSHSGCSQDRVLLWISARSKADRCADSRATVTTVAKRDTCPEIAKMGRRPPNKKIIKGAGARQLEAEKPDDWLQTLASRSYDEIRAFFYDQQVAEMKTQGKEFGA
ncbi:hypothetical protein SERLADRAFT_434184 [Serpula lacrymans var. lacrymans S7.9]|uniref:Uncharacterized protein n=1 Tax=Serpula lacrymans var. lacrymans (strain S7.9) TaxID=578457 RepID=F8NJX3_SERL9|nr:uncharacterized protein SERLADRAFT_434184 [Serpula lacrymans var. lacrymans S7.9]EGO28285.1 hypothetical protein SERLADRAFT_434184 [Serpula lacrymans var. lacrymans S7.9]